jgi:hypothetical protein
MTVGGTDVPGTVEGTTVTSGVRGTVDVGVGARVAVAVGCGVAVAVGVGVDVGAGTVQTWPARRLRFQ